MTKKLITKSTKNIFAIIISSSLVFSLQASADDSPMDQAKAQVQASMEDAEAEASDAVAGDFSFAMAQVVSSLVNEPQFDDLASSLISRQSDLLKELDHIADLNPRQIAETQSAVQAAYDNYKRLVRERFDISFDFAGARQHLRDILNLSVLTMKQFQSNCTTGRGIGGLGAVAFQYPDLPKPEWSVQVGMGNAEPGESGIRYTATGSADERRRNDFSGAVTTTASTIDSIALFGETSQITNMCIAAAPYVTVAAVAVAVAVAYLNNQERIEKEDEIVAAKSYAFQHTATDKDVGVFYREQCSDLSNKLNDVIQVFDTAIENPGQLVKLVDNNAAVDLKAFQKDVAQRDALRAQIAALKNKPESKAKLDDLVQQVENLEQKISDMSNPKRVAQLAVQVLIHENGEFAEKVREVAIQRLDLAQEAAFSKILRILSLVRSREFARFLSKNDPVNRELRGLGEYIQARQLFQQVVVMQIRVIFGRENESALKSKEQLLGAMAHDLTRNYGGYHEIAAFGNQVRNLIGYL